MREHGQAWPGMAPASARPGPGAPRRGGHRHDRAATRYIGHAMTGSRERHKRGFWQDSHCGEASGSRRCYSYQAGRRRARLAWVRQAP